MGSRDKPGNDDGGVETNEEWSPTLTHPPPRFPRPHAIVVTSPPSTRSAAPFVAADSGLAR